MLLRLELTGFKSFADKTSLDFAPGITAIVGPNGSGKSNVVDAIRWLMGEQSIRSLRGGEMVDVIFHGSPRRKSLGMAEVSLVLDNRRRWLAIEADEVQLTRRIYRDGNGEYLINGQPARLKDFRDLFMGSGAGAKGYTIIAQGRVEELLQANPQQRRELFDEAAGISRFKIRKCEALRKLSEVESNLTRSQDRLHSLETQLRTCRLQATKAQKYLEYQTRLRQLRIIWGKYEDQRLKQAICQLDHLIHQVNVEIEKKQQSIYTYNNTKISREQKLNDYEKRCKELSAILADCERRISTEQISIRHLYLSLTTLENEMLQLTHRRSDITHRLRRAEQEHLEAESQYRHTESEIQGVHEEKQQWEATLKALQSRCQEIDTEIARQREQQFDAVRVTASARSAANAALANVTRLQQELQRRHRDSTVATIQRQTLQETLDKLMENDNQKQQSIQDIRNKIDELILKRKYLQQDIQLHYDELEKLRVQYSDVRGRMELLDEWERSRAGVEEGVRQLLEKKARLAAKDPLHPLVTEMIGLVADLLVVPHDIAPLVEIALGDKAQYMVVRSEESLLTLLATLQDDLSNRIGLLPLNTPPYTKSHDYEIETLAERVQSPVPDLPAQLLGNVILVDDWQQAVSLRKRYAHVRIITKQGHLWETDGSVILGSFHTGRGLVSQKSELRELQAQARDILDQLQQKENALTSLQYELKDIESQLTELEVQQETLEKATIEARQTLDRHRQALEHWNERWVLLCQETQYLEEELRRAESAWLESHRQAESAEQAAKEIEQNLELLQQTLQSLQGDCETTRQHLHAAEMKLTQLLSAREHSMDWKAQLEKEIRKRRVEILDVQSAIHTLRTRYQEATVEILNKEMRLSQLYADKEKCELELQQLDQYCEMERQSCDEFYSCFQELQQQLEQLRHRLYELELQRQDLKNQHQYLLIRLQEELEVDSQGLQSLLDTKDGEVASNPDSLVQEMDELKQKMTRAGPVTLEAVDQLRLLEGEYQTHLSQHQDLQQAHRTLLEIIDQLNKDSCKLFLDMLAAVRSHFQDLFRKLFGGGQADIVLENEADVLESGVDIIARPPGKELRSLSLLSGGEKTLTAIALLLAIFRTKPSPFCILDEVDAALDEANTVRLASILREFLNISQFIIVTHKKRTMAAADRLWGVTMTDQGVSRVLPLRFEEWESPAQAA
ncbi:MAG: chromosome segregation protein SMC [Gemmataceae bacterium]|nr:chromosome segregation protein SMC [Gemmataceae bacterium]